jgi:hypothetical protein
MIHPSKMLLVDDDPSTYTRIPSRRSIMARRVSRFVSSVLGLALGKGIAVLLATLSAWFSS